MVSTPEYKPQVQNKSEYIASNQTGTPSEIRKKITELLRIKNIVIAVSPTKSGQLKTFAGDKENPIKSQFAMNGIVHVLANATSGTHDYQYKIESGQPVCLDYSTGTHVTGINPAWGSDEYRIVGIALDSLESGTKRIPVRLIPPKIPGPDIYIAFASSNIPGRVGMTLGEGEVTIYSISESTLSSTGQKEKCFNLSVEEVRSNVPLMVLRESVSKKLLVNWEECGA